MTMSVEAAAQVLREAMRATVKRHSLCYLIQGGLMIVAGVLALVYPVEGVSLEFFVTDWLHRTPLLIAVTLPQRSQTDTIWVERRAAWRSEMPMYWRKSGSNFASG